MILLVGMVLVWMLELRLMVVHTMLLLLQLLEMHQVLSDPQVARVSDIFWLEVKGVSPQTTWPQERLVKVLTRVTHP